MSVERRESREPDSVVQPDPAVLRSMERQRILFGLRSLGIGLLAIAIIVGIFASAYILSVVTRIAAAGAILVHLLMRWLAHRD